VDTDFAMAVHAVPSMSTSYTNSSNSDRQWAITAKVKLNGNNQTIVTRGGTNGAYVYCPHQIFDWSETVRTGPSPAPKLAALSDINSMVKSIEHISVNFEGGGNDVAEPQFHKYVSLTKGQSLENCVPFVTYRANGGSGFCSNLLTGVKLLEPDRLRLSKINASSELDYEIDIVEFEPDQVKVQQGWYIMSGTSTTATISGVDQTKAAVLAYNVTNNGDRRLATDGWARVRFSADDTLTFERGLNYGINYGHYYVFEAVDDQFTVQAHNTTETANYVDNYLTEIAPQNRTFMLNSYYFSDTTDDLRHHLWYMHAVPYEWYFNGYKNASGYTNYHTTFLITLKENPNKPTNVLTQRFFTEFGTGETVRNIDLRHPVSAVSGTTMLVNPMPYCAGYPNDSNGAKGGSAFVAYKLTSTSGVELRRSTTESMSIRSSLQVVDFVGSELPDYTHPPYGSEDLVLSLQHEEFDFGTSVYEEEFLRILPLTLGQDINNCVPFFTYKLDSALDARYPSYRPAVTIDNGEFFLKKASIGKEYFSLDIVEFNPARIKIQYGSFHLTNGTGTYNVTISGVDTSKAFLLFYWYPNTTYQNVYVHAVRGRLTSSTNIEFYRSNASYLMEGYWWVVEALDDSFTVDHADITLSNAYSGSTKIDNAAKDLDKSFMIYSHYFPDSTTDVRHIGTKGYFSAQPPDLYSYINKNTNGYVIGYNMQTIIFSEDSGVNVQHNGSAEFQNGSDASKNFDLGSSVDTSRSIITNPNLFGPAYTNESNNIYLLNNICKYTFPNSSGTQIEASRRSSSTYALSSFQVLEFPANEIYYFSGYVKEVDTPVSREVYCYRRDTGELIGSTTSSGDGYYYLPTTYSGEHFIVALDDDAGTQYNLAALDRMAPADIVM
jgi:hypothetical protein